MDGDGEQRHRARHQPVERDDAGDPIADEIAGMAGAGSHDQHGHDEAADDEEEIDPARAEIAVEAPARQPAQPVPFTDMAEFDEIDRVDADHQHRGERARDLDGLETTAG